MAQRSLDIADAGTQINVGGVVYARTRPTARPAGAGPAGRHRGLSRRSGRAGQRHQDRYGPGETFEASEDDAGPLLSSGWATSHPVAGPAAETAPEPAAQSKGGTRRRSA
jgi:hypothetical protein